MGEIHAKDEVVVIFMDINVDVAVRVMLHVLHNLFGLADVRPTIKAASVVDIDVGVATNVVLASILGTRENWSVTCNGMGMAATIFDAIDRLVVFFDWSMVDVMDDILVGSIVDDDRSKGLFVRVLGI